MNWAMVGAAAISVPLFLPFPQENKRLAVDRAADESAAAVKASLRVCAGTGGSSGSS
jgi:hypothetical protein